MILNKVSNLDIILGHPLHFNRNQLQAGPARLQVARSTLALPVSIVGIHQIIRTHFRGESKLRSDVDNKQEP